jgi:hypothetical protein
LGSPRDLKNIKTVFKQNGDDIAALQTEGAERASRLVR